MAIQSISSDKPRAHTSITSAMAKQMITPLALTSSKARQDLLQQHKIESDITLVAIKLATFFFSLLTCFNLHSTKQRIVETELQIVGEEKDLGSIP